MVNFWRNFRFFEIVNEWGIYSISKFIANTQSLVVLNFDTHQLVILEQKN